MGIIGKLRNNLKEKEGLIEAINAEMIVWKDKDGSNHSKIQVLETQNLKDFLSIQSKDSSIAELQRLAKQYKGKLKEGSSITTIKGETTISDSAPTIVSFTETQQSKDTIYPTYTSHFNLQGWVTGTTVANRDLTTLDLKIRNEYSVVVGREKQGLFKPRKPFVEVINKNPYTETKSLRTYQVSIKSPKRWAVGPFAGIDYHLEPTIGIGITYGLIRF